MKSKSSKDEEKIETVKEEEPTVSTPEEEIQKLKSEVETGSTFETLVKNNKAIEYVPSDKKRLSA